MSLVVFDIKKKVVDGNVIEPVFRMTPGIIRYGKEISIIMVTLIRFSSLPVNLSPTILVSYLALKKPLLLFKACKSLPSHS
jgi:hypothetical protein